jgi:hypothetical protein
MSSTVFGLSYDAGDAKAAASFWAAALGRAVAEGADSDNAVVEAGDVATSGPRIAFHTVPEGKTVKNRLPIDRVPTERTRDAEIDRVQALGATVYEDRGRTRDLSPTAAGRCPADRRDRPPPRRGR